LNVKWLVSLGFFEILIVSNSRNYCASFLSSTTIVVENSVIATLTDFPFIQRMCVLSEDFLW